jgi:hypothetical protein
MKNRVMTFGARHSRAAFVAEVAFFPECHLPRDRDSNRRNSYGTAGLE